MAVVTSSVPLGGDVVGSGGGSALRARSVDSRNAGAPARTGRGLLRRVAGLAFPFGAAFSARGFAAVLVAVPPVSRRSRPTLVGRVAGRLPRTLSSSLLSLIPRQSTFHNRASGDCGQKRGRMRIERLDSAPS